MPTDGLPDDYAIRIKRLRAKLSLTQEALARRLEVSFATINRWENGQGKPSARAWRQIVRAEHVGEEAFEQPDM